MKKTIKRITSMVSKNECLKARLFRKRSLLFVFKFWKTQSYHTGQCTFFLNFTTWVKKNIHLLFPRSLRILFGAPFAAKKKSRTRNIKSRKSAFLIFQLLESSKLQCMLNYDKFNVRFDYKVCLNSWLCRIINGRILWMTVYNIVA